MEEPVLKSKKTRGRKILSTADLNQMDRRSLETTSSISCKSKKKVSKKNKYSNKKSVSNKEFEESLNKDCSTNEGKKKKRTLRNTQNMFVINYESENITPDRRSVRINKISSSDFAITPIISEEICDDVFSETAECDSNTFELENTTFDVSKLPHIDDDSKSHHQFRRSKSLDKEKSVKKSVSFMVNNNKSFDDDVSFLQSTRKSIRFSTSCNNSKKYPKSPHVKKISSVSMDLLKTSESNDIINKSTINESNISRNYTNSPHVKKLNINEKFETGSDISLENKITKRKKWNKSIGVSFFDCSGLLINISPPINLSPELSLSTSVQSEVISSTAAEVKIKNKSKIVRKIPNFALIHERAMNKIESLNEMTERKALRAQRLLSGKKPGLDLDSKQSTKSPKCKLLLSYTPNKRKSIDKLHKSTTMNVHKFLPSSSKTGAIPKKKINKEIKSNIPRIIKKPMDKKKISPKKTEDKKKVHPRKPEEKKKVSPTKPDNKKKVVPKFCLGFGSKSEQISKQDKVKAIATKSKPERNLLDARRKLTQHVRTNRRFELLMQMRNKK